jgi:hypothetical protein
VSSPMSANNSYFGRGALATAPGLLRIEAEGVVEIKVEGFDNALCEIAEAVSAVDLDLARDSGIVLKDGPEDVSGGLAHDRHSRPEGGEPLYA